MGKTIINVAITMADDEWDRYEKRIHLPERSLDLLETAINDTLVEDLGLMATVKITKIE